MALRYTRILSEISSGQISERVRYHRLLASLVYLVQVVIFPSCCCVVLLYLSSDPTESTNYLWLISGLVVITSYLCSLCQFPVTSRQIHVELVVIFTVVVVVVVIVVVVGVIAVQFLYLSFDCSTKF